MRVGFLTNLNISRGRLAKWGIIELTSLGGRVSVQDKGCNLVVPWRMAECEQWHGSMCTPEICNNCRGNCLIVDQNIAYDVLRLLWELEARVNASDCMTKVTRFWTDFYFDFCTLLKNPQNKFDFVFTKCISCIVQVDYK